MALAGIYLIISAGYAGLLWYVYNAWDQTPETDQVSKKEQILQFSVIIAARNESENIGSCISAILTGNYPKESYEIIVIDDHSNDNTAGIVKELDFENVRIYTLPLEVTGKKNAITFGINKARYDYILCTDADSAPGVDWMRSHAGAFSERNTFVTTGIVMPENGFSLLEHFQWMDFAATMAITAAGIFKKKWFLGNGANLGFTKEFFVRSGGYADNIQVTSGDDIFLVQKAAEAGTDKIVFVKSKTGMVVTRPVQKMADFLNQRKRWATKALKTKGTGVAVVQTYVFMTSLLLIAGVFTGLVFSFTLLKWALVAMGIKMVADFLFLRKLNAYYQVKMNHSFFLTGFFMYIIHILYSGLQALFPGRYEWKGRKVQ